MIPHHDPSHARQRSRALRLSAAGALVALLFVSSAAHARPTFPGIVVDTLGLTCTPTCLLCHTTPTPENSDTAVQPFALNIIGFAHTLPGLSIQAATDETLPTILKAMETTPCLNDKDPSCATTPCGLCNGDNSGKDDIAELLDNTNPNNTDVMHCPTYGCGAHVAPASPERPLNGTAALAALGAVAVLVRRWRR